MKFRFAEASMWLRIFHVEPDSAIKKGQLLQQDIKISIQNIQIRVKEINRYNFKPIKDIQIQVAVVHADRNHFTCLNDKPFITLRIYWIGVADVHDIFIFTVVAVDTMVW